MSHPAHGFLLWPPYLMLLRHPCLVLRFLGSAWYVPWCCLGIVICFSYAQRISNPGMFHSVSHTLLTDKDTPLDGQSHLLEIFEVHCLMRVCGWLSWIRKFFHILNFCWFHSASIGFGLLSHRNIRFYFLIFFSPSPLSPFSSSPFLSGREGRR